MIHGTIRRLAVAVLLAGAVPGAPAAAQAGSSAEARTARRFDAMRGEPLLQAAFLRRMPKGGDLHNHLSGAVYAESYVGWAAQSGLCVSRETLGLVSPPCDSAAGLVPAAQALRSSSLYGQLVDAWSMRNWHPANRSGHDQFFDTFGKFGAATDGRTAEMLAEAASRAAHDRLAYLELMQTLDGGASAGLGRAAGWDDDLGRLRDKLLAAGLRDTVAVARRALDATEARTRELLRCGTPQADAGCGVTVRWLYQVSRGRTPEQVFGQILMGFEMASADPRVVGFNLVQPEDALIPMRDYSLQMRMIGYLRRLYPRVRFTLHAGELAPGLVPPEGLRFHVAEAVRVAGASRIGHGVDVMYEDDPFALLREMAERRVLVEIALTSNAVILGVQGKEHPLALYLRHGVPVTLATDDLGVARSDMTMEYLRAARDQGLGYVQLKAMARNSLEHAFVDGASLWRDARTLAPVAECSAARGGMEGAACRGFTERSTRARLQRELERSLAAFEREQAGIADAVPARR
ncbi:MAG TPA: hypothetical protein VF263_04130 [Longimicrobiaceae bacterium]